MNKAFFLCLLTFVTGLFCASEASGQILTSNSITYQTITGTPTVPSTNFGTASIVGQATVGPKQISVNFQNGGLNPNGTTNAMTGWFQISLDNVNWTTVQLYQPASTNATIDVVPITVAKFTVYGRAVIVTTNAVPAGAQIQLIPFVP